jgi:hypothetical protein
MASEAQRRLRYIERGFFRLHGLPPAEEADKNKKPREESAGVKNPAIVSFTPVQLLSDALCVV